MWIWKCRCFSPELIKTCFFGDDVRDTQSFWVPKSLPGKHILQWWLWKGFIGVSRWVKLGVVFFEMMFYCWWNHVLLLDWEEFYHTMRRDSPTFSDMLAKTSNTKINICFCLFFAALFPCSIFPSNWQLPQKGWKRKAVKWVVAWAWARRFWPWWATQASSMSWPERKWAIAQLGLSKLVLNIEMCTNCLKKTLANLYCSDITNPKIKDVQTCNWISKNKAAQQISVAFHQQERNIDGCHGFTCFFVWSLFWGYLILWNRFSPAFLSILNIMNETFEKTTIRPFFSMKSKEMLWFDLDVRDASMKLAAETTPQSKKGVERKVGVSWPCCGIAHLPKRRERA